MIALNEHLKAASLHANRMQLAKDKLQSIIPLKPEKVGLLSVEELGYLELYTSRFSKLQDLLGAKIFPEVLEANGEQIDKLFYIDRINMLEKLEIVSNADEWMEMRKVRNNFSHEYPDKPDQLADNLNKAFTMGPELINCLNRSIAFAKRLSSS